MNAHTENVTIIRDSKGHPDYVVMPYAVYQSMLDKQKLDTLIPAEVIKLSMVDGDISAVCAWRKHLDLTQDEVAKLSWNFTGRLFKARKQQNTSQIEQGKNC